ncbi:MAG: hypothetical protein O3A93_14395 [Chloroflexi bacterium]|nr:hypothetical protein [Chloroflexota bacterium]MDA1272416.1 hypothetical protein [Chloroflexota bacterium]
MQFFDKGDFDPSVGGFFQPGPGGDGRFDFDPAQAPPEGGLKPGAFSQDFFAQTFNPNEFKGDFGQFFRPGDFGKGELDSLFTPGDFKPDDFGTLFKPDEFKAGDFGKFAAVGGQFVDFGGHFDQFFGERGDEAKAATAFFGGFKPGEFQNVDKGALLGQVQGMDFQGFQELDKDVVLDLFKDGLAGQEVKLKGQQWAGAFSKFEPQDIKGFDQKFIEGAVRDFAKEDFLGIPDDQAFALFEATFFGAPPPGAVPGGLVEGGPEGGAPPPFFDPAFFSERLDEFDGQIEGFLGAMGPQNFDKIEDGQLVEMMGRLDFRSPDFDRTVLGAEDLGGIFGALDRESFAVMGRDQIMGAIGGLGASGFRGWDPSAALNVFDNIDFDQSLGMAQMGGLVGAMGPDQFVNIGGDRLVGLFDSFAFNGPEFDLASSGMDRDDIAGMMAAMDGDHLARLGGEGMIGALGQLDGTAMAAWEGGTAFDIFNTVGFDQARDLDQFEGIVGNFGAEQILQLDDLRGLLGGLDFQNNGDVLRDFSFDTLSVLSPEDFQGLDVRQLVDLTGTTGGDGIIGLGAGQLQNIVGSIDRDAFRDFDPSVVGGMFAGMDNDQIGGFDRDTMEAALEAAGANLLGGLGDFNAITGGSTSFDELAELAGDVDALAQDGDSVIQEGVANFFGGNLFGSN